MNRNFILYLHVVIAIVGIGCSGITHNTLTPGIYVSVNNDESIELIDDGSYIMRFIGERPMVISMDTLSYGYWQSTRTHLILNSSDQINKKHIQIDVDEYSIDTDSLKIKIIEPECEYGGQLCGSFIYNFLIIPPISTLFIYTMDDEISVQMDTMNIESIRFKMLPVYHPSYDFYTLPHIYFIYNVKNVNSNYYVFDLSTINWRYFGYRRYFDEYFVLTSDSSFMLKGVEFHFE